MKMKSSNKTFVKKEGVNDYEVDSKPRPTPKVLLGLFLSLISLLIIIFMVVFTVVFAVNLAINLI